MSSLKVVLKKEKFFFLFVFLFSFFIRAILFLGIFSKNENFWTADSAGYHILAMQIANGHGISTQQNEPAFYRLPGYPLFLAICYKLFDFDFKKTLWVQIILSCFIPIFIYFLSLALFPENFLLAKLAALIAVVHNGFMIFSGLLMSETLFCIFFLLFLILFLSSFALIGCPKVFEIANSKKIFFAGLFLGLASLVRPVGHYLILVSILLLIFSNFVWNEKFKKILLLSFGWILIAGLWLLRNYLLTGFVFFHTLPGKHFLNNSAAYVIMQSQNYSYQNAKDFLNAQVVQDCLKKELDRNESLSEIEYCLAAEKVAYKYIRKHPVFFLKYSVANVLKTSLNLFSEEFFFIEKKLGGFKNFLFPRLDHKILVPIVYLELLFLFLIWFGFLGFFVGAFFVPTNWCPLLKALPFICLMIFITLASGFARLRLPIEPLLMIFSLKFWLDAFIKKNVHV
jgi:hypothetical protein